MNGGTRRVVGFASGLAIVAAVLAAARGAHPAKSLRVYFVGNSVTDTVNYRALGKLAAARGYKHTWGRHMIPGAPLFWLWRASPKRNGFTERPYGHCQEALANYVWDALTLQPFDRLLDNSDPASGDSQGDVLYVQKFIDKVLVKSPDVRIYIYARWPRMQVRGRSVQFDKDAYDKPAKGKVGSVEQLDDWGKLWLRRYTGRWDGTNETKDYFETLVRIMRRVNPQMRQPVFMIPAGHVMHELDRRMKAGEVPGHKTVWQVYKDGIHLNEVGSYVVACTFFSTLYRESPKGLPGEPYKVTDARLVGIVQDTVWKVVRRNELSGVAEAPSSRPAAGGKADQ